MKLGIYFIDLFANTLLVFMVLTVLAFSSLSESQEKTLPPVTLAGAEVTKTGSTAVTPVVLSARRDGNGVRYFIGDKEVAWDDLPALLKALSPSSVVLRMDEELATRITIRLLAVLNNLNITNITFAFKVP